MMPTLTTTLDTPVGRLAVTQSDDAISSITWTTSAQTGMSDVLSAAVSQLKAYFAGDLIDFDLPISPEGTPFDRSVWEEMQRIPYGQVRTYGSIAHSIGAISRAVGTACGRNPIPIVVPCHRVVGSGGSLGGFSGGTGVQTKRRLLQIEGIALSHPSDNREQLSLF